MPRSRYSELRDEFAIETLPPNGAYQNPNSIMRLRAKRLRARCDQPTRLFQLGHA